MIVKVGEDYIDLTKVVGMSKKTSNGYPEFPYIAFHVVMGEPIRAGNFAWNEADHRDSIFEQVYGLWKKLKESNGLKQVQFKYTYNENNTLQYKINTIKMNTDVDDLILEVERVLAEKKYKF